MGVTEEEEHGGSRYILLRAVQLSGPVPLHRATTGSPCCAKPASMFQLYGAKRPVRPSAWTGAGAVLDLNPGWSGGTRVVARVDMPLFVYIQVG